MNISKRSGKPQPRLFKALMDQRPAKRGQTRLRTSATDATRVWAQRFPRQPPLLPNLLPMTPKIEAHVPKIWVGGLCCRCACMGEANDTQAIAPYDHSFP